MKKIAICLWVTSLLLCNFAQAQGLPDFTVLVEDNAPAIVSINVSSQPEKVPDEGHDLDDRLRYFFGNPEGSRGGTGSGFIIESDGYIVTNHHVVDGATTINVVLNDRREFLAELIGSDERSDLALLKIDAVDLPKVSLGDSSQIKVGEWVLAIGSPFGLSYSVAAGIISFSGRNLPAQGRGNYVSFIQTDVAINPGHSGGPLFNLDGEVIGINSQIFSNTGGSIGVSFAIPVDVAKNVISQLRETGSVERGWMGVAINEVSQEQADNAGMPRPVGAYVSQVFPNSPAEAAGFEAGDIIIEFDGHEIISSGDLPYYVGMRAPGSQVPVSVVRNMDDMVLEMEVGALSSAQTQSLSATGAEFNALGLVVLERGEATVPFPGESGLLVLEVAGGAGKEAGLEPGDLLLELSGVTLETKAQLTEQLELLESGAITPLLVSRGEEVQFFTLRIP